MRIQKITLKPCPFCGKMPKYSVTNTGTFCREGAFYASFKLGCESCKIFFYDKSEFEIGEDGTVEILKDGYKTAAEKWNMRAKDENYV